MIILTAEEANQVKGLYEKPYTLEPIYLADNKYGLPETIVMNPAYRDAWALLKSKPVELITADEIEGIVAPVKQKTEPLYIIEGKELTFHVTEMRKLNKECGEIALTAIDKNGLHRDVVLSIDSEVVFDIPNVGKLTAIQAMLFFDKEGMSSKAICEMLIPQREQYILDKYFK